MAPTRPVCKALGVKGPRQGEISICQLILPSGPVPHTEDCVPGLGPRGCAAGAVHRPPLLSRGVFIDELPRKPPPRTSQKGLDNPSPTTSRMLPPFQTQSSHTRRAAVGRGAHLKREQLYNQRQSRPATFRKQGLGPNIPQDDLLGPSPSPPAST